MLLNTDATQFIVTIALSFLTGLEVKSYRQEYHADSRDYFIGTARTTTFLGILGFVFYRLDPRHLHVYTAGLLVFSALFALFYIQRLRRAKTSILPFLVTLIVYTYGPLTALSPLWMPALLFVLTVFLLNAKTSISNLSLRLDSRELETLGKMVLLSVVILPLLPNRNVIPHLPLSPFKIWLAVVVVSAISYGGYLSQKYFFPHRGLLVTALIGGGYSSTATTVVLAKKARQHKATGQITAALIAATAVMYLRLIVIAFLFNQDIARNLAPPFLLLALAGFLLALFHARSENPEKRSVTLAGGNPLELKTAFLFAALFVLMILLTQTVTSFYGVKGLKIFAFAAGFTDIDPFILSLLTGKYLVPTREVLSAIVISAGSNNILKGGYALWFGGRKQTIPAASWLFFLGLTTIGLGLLMGR